MYFKDWYRITLNGGANPNGVVLRDLKYPWPTRTRRRFKEFVSSMLTYGNAYPDTVMHSCEWASCGWLERSFRFYCLGDYSMKDKEYLLEACQEWITFWDETSQEFKFPDKEDYKHLWSTPCEL